MVDFKCPECGSVDHFNTDVTTGLMVDGNRQVLEIPSHKELVDLIDHNSDMTCIACGHSGLVFEFEAAAEDKPKPKNGFLQAMENILNDVATNKSTVQEGLEQVIKIFGI